MWLEQSGMSDFQSRCDAAAWFLSVLFEGYEGGFVEMRAFRKEGGDVVRRQDWRPLPLRGLRSFAAELVRLSDVSFDVYVGVLPREEKRGTADSVKQARWMWADFDAKNMHPGQLSAMSEAATMAVDSGYGLHCYWEITPMKLASLSEREVFCRAMRGLQKKGSDGQADNVADLPRILRVPGTWNWKNGEKMPVRLIAAPVIESEELPEEIAPIGDAEMLRIKEGVKGMLSAAANNVLPAIYPAWRSSRGHSVNDPNVWLRGQLTWFHMFLRHQDKTADDDSTPEDVRGRSIIDGCVVEMSEDFTNLFLRLSDAGYDPTNWHKSPLFKLEDIGGN
jgi:hypothetical protein